MFDEEGISHEKFLLGSSNSRAFSNSANSGKKPPTNPTPVMGQKRGRKGLAKAGSSTSHGRDGHGEQSDSEVHIWTERERRKKMRNMFSNLHALLPHLPPKTDKSSIVDEAINYIQTLEQTLKTLHKQRLEKFWRPTILDLEPPLTLSSDQTQTYLGTAGSSRNSSISSNMPLSTPTSSQASFRTWFLPNVVMNMCGNDAQICVCSSRKPGLLATICYILERHKVEVVSANISSDHHRSMFMIHVHADGPSAQFPQASIDETFKLAVGEIVSWLFSY